MKMHTERHVSFRPLLALLLVASSLTLLSDGTAAAAAFPGPNGKIAFDSARDGNEEIYVMNADGSGQVNVSNSPTSDVEPAWSPDGSRIAFVSDRDGLGYELYVMNADGSGQTRLTTDSVPERSPTWSPDGTRIALAITSGGNLSIYSMNADGTGATGLTTDSDADENNPAWSPNGSSIAYYSEGVAPSDPEIYTMNSADGSGKVNRTGPDDPTGASDFDPTWSPDGTRLAFHSNRDGDEEIYTMPAGGGAATQLTFNAGAIFDGRPSWSPDGTRIAFQSERDGTGSEIYVMGNDGSSQTRLTSNEVADQNPDWQVGTPSCTNVSQTVTYQSSANVAFSCSDPGGRSLTYQAVSNPALGSLGAVSGASVSYTPGASFVSSDSFQYRAVAGVSASPPATATVTALDNRAPAVKAKKRPCKKRRKGCTLRGTANDPLFASGVKLVEANIVRKLGSKRSCLVLAKNRRTKRTTCKKASKVWVKAKVVENPANSRQTNWSLKVRLTAGRYKAKYRATDNAGNTKTVTTTLVV